MNCFAYEPDGFAYGYANNCKATNFRQCPGEKCAFFLTPEQAEERVRRANARIAAMDEAAQRGIAQAYYNGKMPWRKKVRK